MNILAFIISLIAGLISFLQGGCSTVIGAIGSGIGEQVGGYEGLKIAREGALIGGAGFLVVLAALIAIIGGCLALPRQKASCWLLSISSGMCLIAFVASGGTYNDIGIWAIAYAVAALCAYIGCKKNNPSEQKISSVSYTPVDLGNSSTVNQSSPKPIDIDTYGSNITTSTPQKLPQKFAAEKKEKYEPVIGLETDALIKRAFLFLDDGQFYDAGRYLNQALNQDAEDARIHIGLLMLAHKSHNIEELIECLDTPIEDEKLFQRALRFSDKEYKSQLEFYARSSKEKLEHKRLAEEAEKERQYQEILTLKSTASSEIELSELKKRIDLLRPYKDTDKLFDDVSETLQEVENERRYQEILALKGNATSLSDLQQLLQLVFSLQPYKDTEQIYNEVNKTLKLENKYQDARLELQNANTISALQNVISILEELNEYKDSEKLLEEAQSKLDAIEESERRRKKMIVALCVLAAIGAGSFFGWRWYKDKQAATARQNAIIAFFEGRYDEADKAITDITASDDEYVTHAALLYIKALIKDKNSDSVVISPNITENDSKFYSSFNEANNLAENYINTLDANIFLGDTYMYGWGHDKDLNKALKHFNLSAESGDIYSHFAIASIYKAIGSNQEALKWYQKLADAGNSVAQKEIRTLNEEMKKPKPSAIPQTTSSQYATSTQIERWYELGNKYLEDKNYSQAVYYFRMAVEQNYAPAQDKLGWMYQNGWGVEKDYSKAKEFYLKAANQGNSFAQASMGLLYFRGWGVHQDLEQALEWYKKAAAQGNQGARKRCEEIERIISNRNNQQRFSQLDRQGGFPVAATISGNKVNVRRSPTINSSSVNQLNSGHPVSVSRLSSESDGDWYYVRTASGTQGWVKGDYVALNNNVQRTQQELDNREKSLPARGEVTIIRIGNSTGNKLNLRNIPSTARTSKVITEMTTGDKFTALERFAEEERDWYRIRTDDYEEGWISGRFIRLR